MNKAFSFIGLSILAISSASFLGETKVEQRNKIISGAGVVGCDGVVGVVGVVVSGAFTVIVAVAVVIPTGFPSASAISCD